MLVAAAEAQTALGADTAARAEEPKIGINQRAPPPLAAANAESAQSRGQSSRKKGRMPSPIWKGAREAAWNWFDEYGCPARFDGGQARLEKFIADWLGERDQHPDESTIRRHVVSWINEYRASVGAN
jgi:hypothetical protein